MVEGPGATRNSRKVQPAIGYTVESVGQEHLQEKLQDKCLAEVISVGKEVFLLFTSNREGEDSQEGETALRLHFGMSGCLYLYQDDIGTNSIPTWRRNTPSSLKIYLVSPDDPISRMCLETKDSTSNLLSARVARSKVMRLSKRDVCGDGFDPLAVMDAIVNKRSDAIISDAILDQDRFPGVGNIIKIEGLHRSKVHPKRIVSTLTRDELQAVVSSCRRYGMGWLSSGRAPAKAVYNQTVCGTCSAPSVRMVKLGDDLSRTTFWCESCQPLERRKENKERSAPAVRILPRTKPLNTTAKATPCCPQHGASSLLLKRVKKTNSVNRNRLFRLCKVRPCPYFVWADNHFPKCACRQTATLRVSKTERTGGRWFLSCRNAAAKPSDGYSTPRGCKFFAWAEDAQLKPFGNSLTPLL
ncbi:unnamed protein product [Cylindrotheca closterium]|uniref:DNA-(apurinic or apyrimidinic site) lyase n=1 Tax=Cylindrotheca closterium TaxID=2856 RepID=A0AAD2FUS8_9STRA|nr:unnamed protein product [Cylindrotheca closterium]